MKNGILYICPTPIGNLEDISLRSLRILEEVDLIAAEDTRHSLRLLNHYQIKKPLLSYHEHNERERSEQLLARLKSGESIALISDAGMPGISDPGQILISLAIEEDIEIQVLPGATASITALVASGLETDKFLFQGFLSSKRKLRREELKNLENLPMTQIFYESPHRLLDSLKDMLEILGNRRIAVARELTKLHEEVFRGSLKEALEKFQSDRIRGEFVLILEGNKEEKEGERPIDIKEELINYLNQGFSKKESVKMVADEFNLGRNEVYKASLELDR